jgi:hypothetical protein
MTTTLAPEIAEFAAAVRAELADLPPEEIDDLTDGLEADLAESVADRREDFGDPSVYADELRAAAGHQPRAARTHIGTSGRLPDLRSLPTVMLTRWRMLLERRPILAGTVAVLATLRPVWWVFRGAVVAALVLSPAVNGSYNAPINGWMWLAVLAAIVVSVQAGRGVWLSPRWGKRALVGLDAVIVIVAPFLIASTLGFVNNMYNAYYDDTQQQPMYAGDTGLFRNGVEVGNIFAYDAIGNPIEVVQLFDQNGEPLNIVVDPSLPWASGDQEMIAPNEDVVGRLGWNVYPLDTFHDSDAIVNDNGTTEPNTKPARWPFVTVKPLAGDAADGAR